jgi:hypothetical protein
MMGIVRLISAGVMYFCVATVMAAGLGAGYAWSTGKLDRTKTIKMLAVLHDIEIDPQDKKEAPPPTEEQAAAAQASFEDIERARAVKARYLELKTQALAKGIDQVRFERQQLTEDKQRHANVKKTFDEKLAALQGDNKSTGYANVRLIWENIKPKQAKEQILQMIEADELDDVVVILSDMPIGKRAKIVSQFTTPEEVAAMDRVLRLIRKGGAEASLLNDTRRQLQTQATQTPTTP